MADSRLLNLPAEVRLNIYTYLNPINAPISAYAGLFLSCKSLYDEATVEVFRNIRHLIPQWEHEWKQKHGDFIHIEIPQTLREFPHFVISLPIRWSYVHAPNFRSGIEDILSLLKVLHPRTIMIRFVKKECEDDLGRNAILPTTANTDTDEEGKIEDGKGKDDKDEQAQLQNAKPKLSNSSTRAISAQCEANRDILASVCIIEAGTSLTRNKCPKKIVFDYRYFVKDWSLGFYLTLLLDHCIRFDMQDGACVYPHFHDLT
ncbi:hypothetical protein K491DRAFT_682677 [Lophiostoma macrostomum CBS 122681]|uniref:Uncharacterized protein n=1 Tax=Lophiostoma macrostomum CBS 122681 TaxID=1314788 RepID=A0A6A6SWI2_9PLEO|nr:hypothetical protein K491DRAFT_682677 [Lophiostoma macrostomum CBS 122681]